jgi:predicted TIM-barrel fold metal-dependent hydrolase
VVDTLEGTETIRPSRLGLVDCDLHNELPGVETLFPYLPEHWVEHIKGSSFKGVTDTSYPKNVPTTRRPDAGADLAALQSQVLDRLGVERALLNCTYSVDSLHNPDAALAFASAVNDWTIAEWLDRDSRLRGSIVTPVQIPTLAAREVERVGDHPGMVQVVLPVRSQHPYGSRLYHPIWEAAVRHDLPVALHFGGSPGNPPMPSGWPSYYVEEYAAQAQVFATQLLSLIAEGVFAQFPTLKVVFLESGFTWLGPHLWRCNKDWRNLRRLVPWVKRPPADYFREHFRVTVQPLDAPPDPKQLLKSIDFLGSDDVLLFSTDYPHRHASAAEEALLPLLPEATARKIAHENARALYKKL